MQLQLNPQSEQLFKFPLSIQGVQSFSSVTQMKQTYISLFDKIYGDSPTIKWTFYFYRSKGWEECNIKYQEKLEEIWKMKCNICTNMIIYGKREGFNEYFLLKMNYYHLHTTDAEKYVWYLKNHHKFRDLVRRIRPKNQDRQINEEAIMNFIQNLPNNLVKKTSFGIVEKHFGISFDYYQELRNKINKKYEISFKQLIQKFNQQKYEMRFLPKDLLEDTEVISSEATFCNKQQRKNRKNPNLPNILLIVTPQMKEQYKSYGQWVGFDLTFSVITERTEQNGEYMLGVLAGSNTCKKIVIFGLVVTNSESSFAYSFIFKSFFEIMQSVPEVIISDEQKGIYFALQTLKKENIFTGYHLFDMFHALRKFRKRTCKSGTFALFTSLMHARNRFQYRKIFRRLIRHIVNDQELQLLRSLDRNSEKYCFSQIPPKFVGIGVSNNINQYFHSLIKNQIPYATNFIKAVQIVLKLIAKRTEYAHKPTNIKHPYQRILHLPVLYPLKAVLSEKVFGYLLREISISPMLRILTASEQREKSLLKLEDQNAEDLLSQKHFYIQDGQGIFLVQKIFGKDRQSMNQKDKWSCTCQLSERCGYPCSHLIKVLIKLDLQLITYINKRWLLDGEVVESNLQSQDNTLKMRKAYVEKMFKKETGEIQHYDINGHKNFKRNKRVKKNKKQQSKKKHPLDWQNTWTFKSSQMGQNLVDSNEILTKSLEPSKELQKIDEESNLKEANQHQKTQHLNLDQDEPKQIQKIVESQQKNDQYKYTGLICSFTKRRKYRTKARPKNRRYTYKSEKDLQGGDLEKQKQKEAYQLLLEFQ